MEKAQIVRYALMQLAALIYGVLACAAALKLRHVGEMALAQPAHLVLADYVRDYGAWSFLLVLVWTGFAGYQSSGFARREVSETALTVSGISLAIFFAVVGTVIALKTVPYYG